jgi:1-pyrroline-5-carboxylate dehydrogenase
MGRPRWAQGRTLRGGRAAVQLRAAELIAGPRRFSSAGGDNAGQGKNVHQAEIDAIAKSWIFCASSAFASQILSCSRLRLPSVQCHGLPSAGRVRASHSPFNFTSMRAILQLPHSHGKHGWNPATTAL